MTTFAQAMNACSTTWNGALSYSSPDPSGVTSGRLSLFFKGARGCTTSQLYEYLRKSSTENLLDTFLLVFHLRDCRGGKGERELGRHALRWLFVNFPDEFQKVLHLLSEYGRWDDILQFFPRMIDVSDVSRLSTEFLSRIPSDLESYKAKLERNQHTAVQIMANQLKNDLSAMEKGEPCSLCAKWSPTEKGTEDKKAGVFTALAKTLGVTPRILRKRYNTPLRTYLQIVERFMCTGRWGAIDYSKVPSHAVKKLKNAFERHDKERFTAWKEALQKGQVKVNAKQLHPHELVEELQKSGVADEITEAQWAVLVAETRKLGSLDNSLIVCDVSGSMTGTPMSVSIALGLLISEVTQGTFHNHVITFHENPSFEVINGTNLYDRYRQIARMPWGGSTNLQGVFELILNRGKACGLTQEQMPKKLFIVSDMQFNVACFTGNSREFYSPPVETNMEVINKMYADSGYTRPQIVFWNVNGASMDFPCTVDENGTALVSGFSPSILKSLIRGDQLTSESIMRDAIDDKRYDSVRNAL